MDVRDRSGLPSGRGMLTAGHYYLPTTTNRLLKIDLVAGQDGGRH